MPTPFMHLHMAERVLESALPTAVQSVLLAEWPAFLLGSVAPDFQAICDVPRQATHFYPIPPEADDYEAFERLLAVYPALSPRTATSTEMAVFMAAYGAHLLYDLVWDHAILTPRFRYADWGEPRERFMAHNTLLTFLDRRMVGELAEETAVGLAEAAVPVLPFDGAGELANWQEMLVAQLSPGAAVRTVEIYAGRLRVSPEQFVAQLEDEAWMEGQVFRHAGLSAVQTAIDEALARTLALLRRYLDE